VSDSTKRCPYCKEEIIADAIKCKHCGSLLATPSTEPYDTLDIRLGGTPTAAGRILSNRYRIVKQLGRGGFGVVYLAHDEELDMEVAVKFLPIEVANDLRALDQLRGEAKLSMTLTHPNIMRLHTLDASGQFKFLVMEYVDGPNLHDVLRDKERLSLEEALPIIKSICEGVEYAHSKRVLHRDLKPANIMINSKGETKVTDFGIACQMRESMSQLSQKDVSGTPAYMAPEHIMGEHLTVRSDIYSLGAVVYELLCGHPPFYQGDILAQIRFKEPAPIPGIPDPVNNAILSALAKDSEKRPESAGAFYKMITDATLQITPEMPQEEKTPNIEQLDETIVAIDSDAAEEQKIPEKKLESEKASAVLEKEQEIPEEVEAASRAGGKGWLVLLIILLILAAGGLLYYFAPWETSLSIKYTESIKKANESLSMKLYYEAINAADEALSECPDSEEAKGIKKRASGMIEWLKDTTETANSEYKKGNFDKSISLANRILSVIPEHQPALEILRKGQEDKNTADNLVKEARTLYSQDHYEAALGKIKDLLALVPEHPEGIKLREEIMQMLSDFESLLIKARIALKEKRYDEATRSALKALEIMPDDKEALNIVSAAKEAEESFTEKLLSARKALEEKLYDEAIASAETALDIKPGDSEAGKIIEDAGKMKKLAESKSTSDAGESLTDFFGTGKPVSGAFSNRFGRKTIARWGGSRATETAVEAALQWLKRHQKSDGSWSCSGFSKNCISENGKEICGGAGTSSDLDVGVTALATLAFLGAGNTPHAGEYKDMVANALIWLIRQQTESGSIGKTKGVDHWIYGHILATQALCEALGLTGSDEIKKAAQKAVDLIVKAQNPYLGWRYEMQSGMNDTCVTCNAASTLKIAKLVGLSVPNTAFEGALNWLKKVTDETYYRTGYLTKGDIGASPAKNTIKFDATETMTAMAIYTRLALGENKDSPVIKGGMNLLKQNLPKWQEKQIDMYYWYCGSLASFQRGGDYWKSWNSAIKEALTDNQRKGGCADGSWDPAGKWGIAGGRVYSTAICCLTLEIYYRYLPFDNNKK